VYIYMLDYRPTVTCMPARNVDSKLAITAGLPGSNTDGAATSTTEMSKLVARIAELEKLKDRQEYRIKVLVNAIDRKTTASGIRSEG